MVLVEVGNNRGPDVANGVAEPVQPGAEGLLRADLEPGEAVVQHPCHSAGEITGIGDRGPVLPGIEQHQAVAVLHHIRVDGPGPGPAPRGGQPHIGGRQVDAKWSGRICTWPVLTTDTWRIGSVTFISVFLRSEDRWPSVAC